MTIEQPLTALLLLTLLFVGCTTPTVSHEPSQALPANDSAFGRSIQAQAAPHRGQSGFRLYSDSAEAFAARAELIRNAQSSIDLQYYIVHDGISTRILVRELALEGMAPALSYHTRLEKNQLVWVTEDDGRQHTLTKEPGSWWRHFNSWLSSAIGLEKML